MDFRFQLERQFRFISNSARAFDEGYPDEAIRIATCLRVIMHTTQKSTSLLSHLGATNINLLSTARNDVSLKGVFYYLGLGVVEQRGGKVTYLPNLDSGPSRSLLRFDQWWQQVVFVTRDKSSKDVVHISRKDIVLGAANKDGGAHVDARLTPEYEALLGIDPTEAVKQTLPQFAQIFGAARDAHLLSLRQMGHEVLNSPELVGLRIPEAGGPSRMTA